MIYQIEYIREGTWNVTCPVRIDHTIKYNFIILYTVNILLKDPDEPDKTKDYNTANWVGFKKSTANISLLNLLKGYICKYFKYLHFACLLKL